MECNYAASRLAAKSGSPIRVRIHVGLALIERTEDIDRVMTENAGFPQPTDEHRWLQSHLGDWKVQCKFFTGPETMEVEGSDSVEQHGPFFVLGHFRASMFGQEFRGLATMGFDTATNRFVSTWCDSFSSHIYQFAGTLSEDKKVLEMSGTNPEPHSGKPAVWRTVETTVDENTRTFEMFITPPGAPEEVQISHYTYTRA